MQEYYSTVSLLCEECSNEVYHGYEFIRYEDLNFCQDSCYTDWMLKHNTVERMYLTNKKGDR